MTGAGGWDNLTALGQAKPALARGRKAFPLLMIVLQQSCRLRRHNDHPQPSWGCSAAALICAHRIPFSALSPCPVLDFEGRNGPHHHLSGRWAVDSCSALGGMMGALVFPRLCCPGHRVGFRAGRLWPGAGAGPSRRGVMRLSSEKPAEGTLSCRHGMSVPSLSLPDPWSVNLGTALLCIRDRTTVFT